MLKGYLSYLVMSAVGLVPSTGAYVGLMWGLGRIHLSQNLNGVHSSPLALSMQLIAALLGMFFNYELNRNVIWPNAKKVIAGSPKSDKFLVTGKLDPSPSLSPTQAAKAINFK